MVDLPATGSHVQITTSAQTYTGTLLPQESDLVVLKLTSGYNIGILPKHITGIKELDSPSSTQTEKPAPAKQDTSLPTITLLHTGGTIASKVDYSTGAVVADFDPASLLELFPELASIAEIKSEFLGNMFSDDFRFVHFNKIISAAFKALQGGQKKIIVTSGTDFLHYIAAALSFAFKDIDVSILVVGSQRSSDRGSSDAGMNLICAAQFLATTDFQGVGVCMHASTDDDACFILPGVNSRKMHASRRDAFRSINTTPLALVDYEKRETKLLRELPKRLTQDLPTKLPLFKDSLKIGLCYAHPHMYAQELLTYNDFDGLILAGSGLGHFPCTAIDDETSEHTNILNAIKTLAQTLPVLMTTQTLHGKVNMNVYSQGRKLNEAGVLGNFSAMTPETAFMKLAYLLSIETPKDKLQEELLTNYVGEQDVETLDTYEE